MRPKTTSCGTATIRCGVRGYEVLLVQPRPRSPWGFPKGHTEPGEDFQTTAARETLEETGIDVIVMHETLGTTEILLAKEHKTVRIFMAYPASLHSEPQPADGENHDVRWWPVDKLPTLHHYQQGMASLLPDIVHRLFDND